MFERDSASPATVRSFRDWGCDDVCAELAAAAVNPPTTALKAIAEHTQYLHDVHNDAERFARRAKRIRREADRLRLLETAAVETLRGMRAKALEAREPHLLSWSTLVIDRYARSRWSSLRPGDRIEELSLDDESLQPTSTFGLLLSPAFDREPAALSIQWDDGRSEVIVPTAARAVFRSVDREADPAQPMIDHKPRRRAKTVGRLRKELVAGTLRPGEKLIADALAETTVHSLLDRTVDRGILVILYATTDRVLWAGIDGSESYLPRPLGDDGFVRGIEYGGFLDFVAGSANEGPRGRQPGPGFGFLALSASDASALPPNVAEGLASIRELRIWAMEVTGTDEDLFGTEGIKSATPDAEFFQLFHFPIWGPVAANTVAEASKRNSQRSA